MSERADDPLLGTSSLLQTIPPAWREVIQGLRDTLVYAEEERDRLREALDRTTTEFRELLVELDALRQARVAAESTSIVRGEVVATVGRTMRTPADAILGLAGLLRSSSLLPTQRAYVDAVHGAAEALRSALNEVSDYSRLEGGTLPLEPIGFDLPLTARDLAAQLGVQAAAKGVGLRITCRPDAPPRLHGDPGRVRQIVAALVGDAISRVERGEIEVEVGPARLDIGGGGVTFVVQDPGPAIPQDLFPTIFEPFARGDTYYPARDGGLALPIARQLAHLMGGTIEVANVPGSGTRFTVILPLPASEPPPALPAIPAAESQARPAAPAASRPAVLVVEADGDQRAGWIAIAEAAGYEPSGVTDRVRALKELAHMATAGRAPAAVIFSDHDALGYDAIGREILNDVRLGRPALILLPAAGNPGDASSLRDAGFRGYLVKPVAPADLREALEALRRTPRAVWHTLFLTRHALAEARRGGSTAAGGEARLERRTGTAAADRRAKPERRTGTAG